MNGNTDIEKYILQCISHHIVSLHNILIMPYIVLLSVMFFLCFISSSDQFPQLLQLDCQLRYHILFSLSVGVQCQMPMDTYYNILLIMKLYRSMEVDHYLLIQRNWHKEQPIRSMYIATEIYPQNHQ